MLGSELSSMYKFYVEKCFPYFNEFATRQKRLKLYHLSIETLEEVFSKAKDIFKDEPSLIDLQGPYLIVGDIHGQILDLFRIFHKFGLPPTQKYVFLGDYVDRGEFSLETIVLILTLKIMWPDSMILLRGNHEIQDLHNPQCFICNVVKEYNEPKICN